MSVLEQPLVFVDLETNGLSHIRGRIIEVAAIRVEEGRVVREYRTLVNPGTALPQFITGLTGITQAEVDGAPLFMAAAHELRQILDGAIFVAHNVRFDYAFLKQEFKRVGVPFAPRQLCTMRLSRALFPEERSHKLQSLIDRHQLAVSARHRAYDDAHALWQFLQLIQQRFPADHLEMAITKQLKRPSLPKALDPEMITALPTGPGVYIMYDDTGAPLYVGKSIHIRQRVTEHFIRDHADVGEFKLSQNVHRITAYPTNGELEALLLESQLVKELLPYQNKLLRRANRLVLAVKEQDADGYMHVRTDVVAPDAIAASQDVLAVYDRRTKMRTSLQTAAKEWRLCPKLMGLEKSKGSCFWFQLGKCNGACIGKEPAERYNARLVTAFTHRRLQPWPYKSPIVVEEAAESSSASVGLVVDRWCVVAKLRQEEGCEPTIERQSQGFDLDTYNILKSYLTNKMSRLSIRPISAQQLQAM